MSFGSTQRSITTDDGRVLEVFVAGPAEGLPLVFHVGTPAAGAPFPLLSEAAVRAGMRTVIYSRPGYGASTRMPDRRVVDAASDTAAVLAGLGHDGEFLTIGWSGGGPHALACAAVLGDRCHGAVTIGGVAPHGPGFDWSAGMGEMNVEAFGLAISGGASYERSLLEQAEVLSHAQPDELSDHFASLLSEPDRMALLGPAAEFLASGFRRAVEHGIWGWHDDEMAFLRHPWGFDLEEVDVPVHVWQGGQDLMTPIRHAEWLLEHLPDAHPHLMHHEGHISILVNHLDEIVAAR